MLTNLRNQPEDGRTADRRVAPIRRTSTTAACFELRADGKLHVLERLNAGSEVEDLALALPPRT